MRLFFLAVGFLALLPLADADAGVERRYYDIRATNAKELAAALSRGPIGVVGLTELARSDVRWQPRRARGGYVVDSIQLDERIIQTLPRWVNRSRAPACLQREWDRLMGVLQRHEDRHRQRYSQYVRDFRHQAKQIPPQPSQMALYRVLAQLNARLKAETEAWQQDYDRRTQHGHTEGLVLRPC